MKIISLHSARRGAIGVLTTLTLLANAQYAVSADKVKPVKVAESGFTFAAYGDSRPMFHLPNKEDGQPDLAKIFVESFGLIMSEQQAEELVKRSVKATYDPVTKELTQVTMPFMSKSQTMTMAVDKGWVTEASVEDSELKPGVNQTIFRLHGGEWVTREIVREVQSGRARFILSSGDIVWWGNQGANNPYWQRFKETTLDKLPPPDAEMRAAGLDGRWFVGLGNHEAWGDVKIEGLMTNLPYLKKLGITAEHPLYKFDFKGTRFINLWTGQFDPRSPSAWNSDQPKYAEQMKELQKWMDEAKAKGIRKVFINFHFPVFARAGFGGMPGPNNPHKIIAAYAKDMEVVVFNGHVHTTEMFDVDGVKYLLLGGGGAEQDPLLPTKTPKKFAPDYPQDLYWRGQGPKEEYNYVLAEVKPGQPTKFILNRYRPWSAEPFESVELFK